MDKSVSPKVRLLSINKELTNLAETYAIRARELSDAVATLGRRIAAGEQTGENIREVERLGALADQARENLLSALEPEWGKSRTSSSGMRIVPPKAHGRLF